MGNLYEMWIVALNSIYSQEDLGLLVILSPSSVWWDYRNVATLCMLAKQESINWATLWVGGWVVGCPCTPVLTTYRGRRRTLAVLFSLAALLFHWTWNLLLHIDWQSASPSHPPASASHSPGVTAAWVAMPRFSYGSGWTSDTCACTHMESSDPLSHPPGLALLFSWTESGDKCL